MRAPILTSAEGNPFFVEEMLQMLIEEGALERQSGAWTATGRLSEVRIPDSVHGVIAARMDLLEASERDALRRCSVVGRVFWPSAVGVDENEIAALSRRGLVIPQPNSVMAGLREFAFKHALTRDVAYGSLPRNERRDLHRRVAEWIHEVAPDRDVDTAELAAYHFRKAISYGEEEPAVVARAYSMLLSTGESAMHRGAFVAARTQFEHAAPMAGSDDERASVLLALAELDAVVARWEDAIDRLASAELLVRGRNPRIHSAVLALRSRVCWMSGRWEEAFDAAAGAVSALAGLPGVGSARPGSGPALADRNAEEPARGSPTLGRGNRCREAGRGRLCGSERTHQSLHRQGCGRRPRAGSGRGERHRGGCRLGGCA